MTPEGKARQMIDARLEQSGWIVQDFAHFQRHAAMGVAVREYSTSTGPVEYYSVTAKSEMLDHNAKEAATEARNTIHSLGLYKV